MISNLIVSSVASFDVGPHKLESLKTVNYIYGANGSGKTTMSRILMDGMSYPTCSIERRPGPVLPILVFNQDFIRKNLAEYDSIKGVFSMGEGSVQTHTEISKVRTDIESLGRKIEDLDAQLKGGDRVAGLISKRDAKLGELRDYCWESIYKKYKGKFTPAFQGCVRSKDVFLEKVMGEIANTSTLRSLEYLEDTARIAFDEGLQKLKEIVLPSIVGLHAIESNYIWTKCIVGSSDVDIASLIEALDNGDWVAEGRYYLDMNNGKCPFCHQEVPGLKEKLDKYFDASYAAEVKVINDLTAAYKKEIDSVVQTIVLAYLGREDIITEDVCRQKADELRSCLEGNLRQMQAKCDHPSNVVALLKWTDVWNDVVSIVQNVNAEIRKRNDQIDNQALLAVELKSEIWRYIINESRPVLDSYLRDITSLNETIVHISNARDEVKQKLLQKRIELQTLSSQLVSVLPTITEINGILMSFGFTQFKLDEGAEATYKLIRPNGTPVEKDTLSEGEKSFLAFLYFYHIVKGGVVREEINADKIVVVDDPVSSLDGEVLFIVSVLTRQLVDMARTTRSNVRQILILTHNVYFHKEVTYAGKNGSVRSDEKFWVIQKGERTSRIVACEENPIRSSYEQLWKQVREANNLSEVANVRNTMRRILEHYFEFLGGESLKDVMENLPDEDKLAGRSLLMWMHDGSHTVGEDLFCAVNGETVEMYKRVFKQIFTIKHHQGHYNMMMKIENERDGGGTQMV